VPFSIARAALFQDAVLAPLGGPEVGVIATAKVDLSPGDIIAEFGGYHAYGVAENSEVISRDRLLPLGIALGSRVKRTVAKDQALTFDDVEIPSGRTVDKLYAEQEACFPLKRSDD
jgi:predicted homoserine dehydrogenase-like protein